jgi:hypothetical protein
MIVSERVSESLACLQIVVNRKMHYVAERAEDAPKRAYAGTTAALRQNHSCRQSAPRRSTVN